jgi:hypothetical protein
MTVDLDIELLTSIPPQVHRVLRAALDSNRLTIGDLDILVTEDLAVSAHIADIRQELEHIADQPYSTEQGERFCDLVAEWLDTCPFSFLAFLDEVEELQD